MRAGLAPYYWPRTYTYRNNSPVDYADPLFLPPVLTSPTARVLTSSSRTAAVTTATDMRVTNSAVVDGPCIIRDVRWAHAVGLHIRLPGQIPPQTPGDTAAIATYRGLAINNAEVVCLEGCYIEASEGLAEGLQLLSNTKLILLNCRIEGIRSFDGDGEGEAYTWQHCDLIQMLAGSLYMRNCTLGHSVYQGIFANGSSGPITEIYLENVNLFGIRRQPLWVNNVGGAATPVVKRLSNVYNMQYWSTDPSPEIRPPFPLPYSPDHKNWSYSDSTGYPYSAAFAAHTLSSTRFGGAVALSDPKYVANLSLLRGAPLHGDYAPAERVGRLYDPAWFAYAYRRR